VTETGVDALSLGATKNGALAAEAVVILNPTLAGAVPFVRKSAMQLASKMRFASAQLVAMFGTDLYLRNAGHANSMAARLYHAVHSLAGVQAGSPPQANAMFPVLPIDATRRLQESYRFYVWNQFTGQVRWMCSWDTTAEDIDGFAAAVARELA
jgi:threonine aldolase